MNIKFASAKLKYLQAALILILAAAGAYAQTDAPFSINESPLPAPTGAVNDYAGVIDPATKQQLEDKLKKFKADTGVELAVAVVKTTGDRPIFDYSLAVSRGWKIGSKADDNPSALLFVAIDDRKYFTQVSKDLEDELPDGIVGNLQRQYLVPEFRKGNYAKGISDTVDAYIQRTVEQRGGVAAPAANTDQPRTGGPRTSQGISTGFCCLLIVGGILLLILTNRGRKNRKNDHDDWGGGFGGGGSALPWVIGSILASGSGSSSSSDWGSSSGGSDWGGFGGGGDFGGGGAGGDW